MNIQAAKDEIARTLRAYTKRNPDGSHRIPLDKQRPVLMIGPPGIGKTAIMKQIQAETGCGLLSYTMTHHTRQSAIGLPYISHRTYRGTEVQVTEYTMSEIVAAIYEYMETSGKTSGILFLDEINCVSETLAPVMLQLLQNKTFGNNPLPEDWIIVAAGNPPEYNKSVRELDMVTLDRVKNIDVEADLAIWQKYARECGVHPAIRTYLTVFPEHFYQIRDTDRGRLFVTARGWEDLSCILLSYEEDREPVSEELVLQYLQHDAIAHSFYMYYDLFRHYSMQYGGTGDFAEDLASDPFRLAGCQATECLSISAMLFHRIQTAAVQRADKLDLLRRRRELIALIPQEADFSSESVRREFFRQKYEAAEIRVKHNLIKPVEEFREKHVLASMEADTVEWVKAGMTVTYPEYGTARIKEQEKDLEKAAERISAAVEQAYQILSACPEGESSLLYFTADLTGDPQISQLLQDHPTPSWQTYCRKVLENS